MPPLYLVEQGAVLAREGECLVVRKEGRILLRVPAFKVEAVFVFGHVQLTTPAIELLLRQGIEVGFFTLSGRLKGRLVGLASKNVFLRLSQFRRAEEAAFRLDFARRVVAAKIHNARRVLVRQAREHPTRADSEAVARLGELGEAAEGASDERTLRGIEGTAAAVYFRAMGRLLPPAFAFPGRRKRPPPDPINALLSLGYALLTHEAIGRLTAHGFDPYIGFYHGVRYGRAGLALDLVEEFRHPVVDRLVWGMVNRRMVGPEDFLPAEGEEGVRLAPAALRRFLAAYEAYLRRPVFRRRPPPEASVGQDLSFRDLLDLQVRRLAHAVHEGKPYIPFRLEE